MELDIGHAGGSTHSSILADHYPVTAAPSWITLMFALNILLETAVVCHFPGSPCALRSFQLGRIAILTESGSARAFGRGDQVAKPRQYALHRQAFFAPHEHMRRSNPPPARRLR